MNGTIIEVRFFAALRERVGEEVLRVSPPAAVTTVAALCDWLTTEYPAVGIALEATPGAWWRSTRNWRRRTVRWPAVTPWPCFRR
ncbi:hypothetical protein ASALC70_04436 [Alcanivorax sp. ALC70]|nr:hypothetical protein ASALC70_04436 [Alcanivorax sp. ALC70]